MKVNLVSVNFQPTPVCIAIRIMNAEQRDTTDQYENHSHSLYLTREEVLYAQRILRGENMDFIPYFDDGCQLVKFTEGGIKEVYLSGQRYMEYYYCFPGKWFAEWLERALLVEKKDEEYPELEIPTDEIARITDEYAIRVWWKFQDYSFLKEEPYWQKYDIPDVFTKLMADKADPRQKNLTECLNSLVQIAENHHYGPGECEIFMRYDSMPLNTDPASYIWTIFNDRGDKIIWGGLIPHRVYRDGKYADDEWEYQTHT